MSFQDLKKNRATAISRLTSAAEKASGGEKNYGDDRFWAPTVDKAGNGYAVIRFLPAPQGEELPWIRYWDHGFKGPTGKWYIENSLSSIGQQDPLGEANSKLWATGTEANKQIVRNRKRRLHYVANIFVITDSGNPANEGKEFLYKFGKKIFDKIVDEMTPEFPDDKPVNPFDLWEGANFKLKIRQVEGYRNYDKSEFDEPSQLFGGDEQKLEAIYGELKSLKEFLDPKNYKSYADLEKKLKDVLGENGTPLTTAEATTLDDKTPEPTRRTAPAKDAPTAEPATAPAKDASPTNEPLPDETDDGETTLSYFAKLAAEK